MLITMVNNELMLSKSWLKQWQMLNTMVIGSLMKCLNRDILMIDDFIESMGTMRSLMVNTSMLVSPQKLLIAWQSWHMMSDLCLVNILDSMSIMRHLIM